VIWWLILDPRDEFFQFGSLNSLDAIFFISGHGEPLKAIFVGPIAALRITVK